MIYLFDVNLLVALIDPRHSFNAAAVTWTNDALDRENGWATCAITENGFLRVGSSQKFLGKHEANFPRLMAALMTACRMSNHQFWSLDRSIRHLLPLGIELAPKQITDIYLLAIAVDHGGKLATFDRSVPAHLIPGGVDALEVISA